MDVIYVSIMSFKGHWVKNLYLCFSLTAIHLKQFWGASTTKYQNFPKFLGFDNNSQYQYANWVKNTLTII